MEPCALRIAVAVCVSAPALAHDIPNDVTSQAWLTGAAALIGLVGGVIWLMRGAFSGQIGPPSRLLEQHTRLGETSER